MQRLSGSKARVRLLGAVEGRVFVVIYTMRGSTIRGARPRPVLRYDG